MHQREFDRQIANLFYKGYPEICGLQVSDSGSNWNHLEIR